jgi:hypothetical protein
MSSRATVEWYSRDKSEELEETSVPAKLCTHKYIRIRLTYRVCRFKTVRGQWNSSVMKVRSTTSIREEVNPSASRRKILRHVKNPCEVWQRYFSGKMQGFFCFLPAVLPGDSSHTCFQPHVNNHYLKTLNIDTAGTSQAFVTSQPRT